MKKIYLVLSFIFLLLEMHPAKAIETLQPADTEARLFEAPVILEPESSHINLGEKSLDETQGSIEKFRKSLAKTAHDVYELQIENTSAPASLLEKPLTWEFEEGPVENLHIWGVVQTNTNFEFYEGGENNQKFKVGLINVLFDSKLRGGKEEVRLMLDTTPSHRNFWQQFVQDAYIQTKRIPHHTILVGNSRPGVGIEGAQSPYTLPLLNRSQISRHFANARKAGIRVKGNYSLVDYDFGGYSSDTFFTEFMPGVEFNGWVNAKPLGKTDGRYGKLVVGGGIATGERNSTDFFVAGANIGYEYKKFWMRAEYANADGSNGSTGLTSKQRQGWYATAGYHLTKKLELIARYDEFDPDKNVAHNNRREYTAGANYYIKGQALKLVLNYVYCQNQGNNDTHRLLLGTQLAL